MERTGEEQRIIDWLRRCRDLHKKIAIENMAKRKPWIDIANVAARYAKIAKSIELGEHKVTDK